MIPCNEARRPINAMMASTAATLSGRNARNPARSGSSPSPGETVIAFEPVTAGFRKSTRRAKNASVTTPHTLARGMSLAGL